MVAAFDAQAVPVLNIWQVIVPLVLLAGCVLWRLTGRKLHWFAILFIGVIVVFWTAVPAWDHLRLRNMLSSGEGITVTRGRIDQTWHIVDRRRDYSKNSPTAYKTVVSEGFDVGPQRFSWTLGGCLSPASLCDLSASKVPLQRGMEVEVSWFADPAQQDEPRILRLMVKRPG